MFYPMNMRYSVVSNGRILQQFNCKEEAENAIKNYWFMVHSGEYSIKHN